MRLRSHFLAVLSLTLACGHASAEQANDVSTQALATRILQETNCSGGLIVHLHCGDGALTEAFARDGYRVHGLSESAKDVAAARSRLLSTGVYGNASIDLFDGRRLPYIDNLANLIVAEQVGQVPLDEILRVLAPGATAYLQTDAGWTRTKKARPKELDEWTHYLYDSSNNAVAKDQRAGPPRGMQWVAGPRFSRHHDKMTSLSAMVSAQGRVFYIFDEASRASILLPPKWMLVARDAFNGIVLWKRPIDKWHSHLWPLKNGPAQLPRRLVAVGDRVFTTMRIDGPVEALDAASGQTLLAYDQTDGAEEIVYSSGDLFVVAQQGDQIDPAAARRRGQVWEPSGWTISAHVAETGETLWTRDEAAMPNTLAVNDTAVVYHNGAQIVCLNRQTGTDLWRSEGIDRGDPIRPFYAPTLVLYEDVVLFSGGETASHQTGSWYRDGKDTMSALDVRTGKLLWKAPHPPSGYRSAEDLLVVDGLVWTGETTSGRAEGLMTGRDPRTGEVKRAFTPDVETYWFHHRCYRAKATDKFLLMSRTGVEFVDVQAQRWTPNHFVRGACLYGVMPANGLVYTPQHPCACYMEAKLSGFNALAPQSTRVAEMGHVDRLVKGPAYSASGQAVQAAQSDWPTYRYDTARSGHTPTSVNTRVTHQWRTSIGGRLSSPIVAGGLLYIASIDTHTIYAIDAETGEVRWRFTAGGRIDSPPTWYQDKIYFGSADGWVYCLRARVGELVWRFLAAPADRRTMAFEQLESVWPVHGSTLIQNGQLYCVAGRSMFLDGGLRLWRLDPSSGQVLSETILDRVEQETGKRLQEFVSWLNMPTGLPDVLSSDGQFVYMRSQPFDLTGKRLPLAAMPRRDDADQGAPDAVQSQHQAHIFSPSGFLDDSWWHRSYWMYGTMYVGGWQGYFRAGKTAPAGRILVHDDTQVYGFGRKPKYWKWTTPLEHHLFASPKAEAASSEPTVAVGHAVVRIENSESLALNNTPFTIAAWINAETPDGVIAARGGNHWGFTLYLREGRPEFAVRVDQQLVSVQSNAPVVGRWTHLTGTLTEDKQLRLFVDGTMVGTAEVPSLLGVDPADTMQIGCDENSLVGPYDSANAFTGLIDQVRFYRRSLSDAEIGRATNHQVEPEDAALAYDFNDGEATDGSSNENHGHVDGTIRIPSRFGDALRFTSGLPSVPGFEVTYRWTTDVPLHVRGMVLANDTLFVAGPEDLVDEEHAVRHIDSEATRRQLSDQQAAWAGERGAKLWAVSTSHGEKLTEYTLDSSPVFDGMIAAGGKLYIAAIDGTIECLAEGP